MALFESSRTLLRRFLRTMRTWSESSMIVDKKSKFQGRCCGLKCQDEISKILEDLVNSTKAVSKATHPHMYAWRTGDRTDVEVKDSKRGRKSSKMESQIQNLQQGCNDCGEAGAGQRLLTLLEHSGATNVLVVVTRWYGGTPLGSARFRHITTAAVESLKKAGHAS
ncbi:LAME_0F14774g1_1 [Lachancea meyersii CBS 8951]|uniref:LAME_0F14774g1_1 n=1 Tax=Lachancea meyersii CBS 8951 TaxID=1266667 RepID=A0A1G4JY34_9SACH|nr:LAME_0F14774g1_1 [Lachancea meyersii CBS 8951]